MKLIVFKKCQWSGVQGSGSLSSTILTGTSPRTKTTSEITTVITHTGRAWKTPTPTSKTTSITRITPTLTRLLVQTTGTTTTSPSLGKGWQTPLILTQLKTTCPTDTLATKVITTGKGELNTLPNTNTGWHWPITSTKTHTTTSTTNTTGQLSWSGKTPNLPTRGTSTLLPTRRTHPIMQGDRNTLTVTTNILGTDTLATKIMTKTHPIMTTECPWAWTWSTTQTAPSGTIVVYQCKTHPILEASNTTSTLFEWPTPTLGSTSTTFGDFNLKQEIIPWYKLLKISGNPMLVSLVSIATAMQARQLLPLVMRYTIMGYTQFNYLTQADIKTIYNYNQNLASILHKSIITATQQIKNYHITINVPEVIKPTGVTIIRTTPINAQIVYVGKSLGNIIYMTTVLQGYWKATMFVKQSWSFFDQIEKALEKASAELRATLSPAITLTQTPISTNPVIIKRIIQKATIEITSNKPELSHIAIKTGYKVIDLSSMLKAGEAYTKELMKLIATGPIIFASISEYTKATKTNDMERILSKIINNNIKTGIKLSNIITKPTTTTDQLQKIIKNNLLLTSSISYSTGIRGLSNLITAKTISKTCQDPTPTNLLKTFTSTLKEYTNIGLSLSLAMLKASEIIQGKSPIITQWIDYLSRILTYTEENKSIFSQVIGKLAPKDTQKWFLKIITTTPYFTYLSQLITYGIMTREAITLLNQISNMITNIKNIVTNPKQTIYEMAWKLAKTGASIPGTETHAILNTANKIRTLISNITKPTKTCPMIDESITENEKLWVLYKIYPKRKTKQHNPPKT